MKKEFLKYLYFQIFTLSLEIDRLEDIKDFADERGVREHKETLEEKRKERDRVETTIDQYIKLHTV